MRIQEIIKFSRGKRKHRIYKAQNGKEKRICKSKRQLGVPFFFLITLHIFRLYLSLYYFVYANIVKVLHRLYLHYGEKYKNILKHMLIRHAFSPMPVKSCEQ